MCLQAAQEVVSPAAHDLVKPDQRVPGWPWRCLLVRARTLSFSDRIGRLAMKVQAYHLSVPRLRFHWMRSRGNRTRRRGARPGFWPVTAAGPSARVPQRFLRAGFRRLRGCRGGYGNSGHGLAVRGPQGSVNRLALGVRGGRRQQNPSASASAATRPFTPRPPSCYYGPLSRRSLRRRSLRHRSLRHRNPRRRNPRRGRRRRGARRPGRAGTR